MQCKKDDLDRAFQVARAAYKAEMALSLRTWSVWREQAGYVLIGLLRAAAVPLVFMVGASASRLFGEMGPALGFYLGFITLCVGLAIFPGWFMHNVFSTRARAAYHAAIEAPGVDK